MHSFRTCEGFILAVLLNFLLTNTLSRKLQCEYSLVMSKDARAKCIRDCVFDCVCSKLAEVTLFLFSLEAVPKSLQDTVRNRKIPHSACEFCLAMNYS